MALRQTRRSFLKLTVASWAAATVSSVLSARTASAAEPPAPTAPAPATRKELIKATMPAFAGVALMAGTFIAIKRKGFDQRAGLDVEFRFTNSVEEVNSSLAAGRADVNPTYFVEIAAGQRAKGAPIKIIMTSGRTEGILVGSSGRTDLSTITGFKGKKVALSKASFGYGWLRFLARRAGYDFDKEVRLINIPWLQVRPEIAAGNVDAGLVFEPDASIFLQVNKDFAAVFNISNEMEKTLGLELLPTMTMGATESWLKANPDGPQRLLEMWRMVRDYATNQLEEFASIMAEPVQAQNRIAGGVGVKKELMIPALKASVIPGAKGFQYVPSPVEKYLDNYKLLLDVAKEAGLVDVMPKDLFLTGLK